jgi:aspartate/methionine/tyrosine aminotransferase
MRGQEREGNCMKPFASVPEALPPQGVRVIMDMAWKTPGCIHLEVGEPDFTTPSHIVEAAIRAARDGCHKYTRMLASWNFVALLQRK